MGNVLGSRRVFVNNGDEESAVVFAFAEAAALGARSALMEAYRLEEAAAAAAAADPAAGDGAGGGGAAPAPLMVGGVLSISNAAYAAAEGADNAVRTLVRHLPPAHRRVLTEADLRQVQAAAAAGAASGVQGAAFMAAMYAPAAAFPPALLHAPAPAIPPAVPAEPDVAPAGFPPPAANPQPQVNALNLDRVAAAGAAGAWKGCFASIRSIPFGSSVNSWASRLSPLLGACVAVAASLAPHFRSASHWETFFVLGGIGLVLFTLMVGVAAVPFTSATQPETISRHSAFLAFTTIGVIFVSVFCYFLRGNLAYVVPVGIFGSAAVAMLLFLWHRSGSYK